MDKKKTMLTIRIVSSDVSEEEEDETEGELELTMDRTEKVEKLLTSLYSERVQVREEVKKVSGIIGGILMTSGLIDTPRKPSLCIQPPAREESPLRSVPETSEDSLDSLPCAQRTLELELLDTGVLQGVVL